MTKQQFIEFGPLVLAAYASITSLLYLAAAGRLAPHHKFSPYFVQILWPTFVFVPSLAFVRWYAGTIGIDMSKGLCSGDQFVRIVMLVILGLFGPVYAVFGFVACQFPEFWQRYNANRSPRRVVPGK